ncbi:MAG TPA: CPBP family intramembrane glutamic endopeptidase [Rhizomicrobium sp.]|nr:CPBP family intramembrane glutamic endopeptidase [Rhizomicrobium sp.]
MSEKPTLSPPARALSLGEFLLGAAIVVAHNVFHVVPNEVPILFVLALVSIRLREGSWGALGLGRPKSWGLTILIALAAAIAVIGFDVFLTDPLAHLLGLREAKSAESALGLKRGDVASLAKALLIIWTFAAFGEEIVYRRYLIGRAADVGNGTAPAYWLALLVVSVLFGIGHFYQGSAGVFKTAVDGFIIGAAYLLARRNLWVAVLAHGFVDTIVFAAFALGLAD